MKLREALKKVEAQFSNRMAKDSDLYKEITEELFGEPCNWEPEMLARVEASISSAEGTESVPGIPGPTRIKEKGYNSKVCLITLFRCLLEIYARKSHEKTFDVDISIIKSELYVLYNLIKTIIHRKKNPKEEHLNVLENTLVNIQTGMNNTPFCYHSGYRGHSIYINYFAKHGELYASICNLGSGRKRHSSRTIDDRTLIYPMVLQITDIKEHVKSLYEAKTYNKKMRSKTKEKLLDKIYKSGVKIGKFVYSGDMAQETGNCVIKNYLQSMLCRLGNEQHYHEMITAVLSVLASHIAALDHHIRPVRNISPLIESLANTQALYRGIPCDELKETLTPYQTQKRVETSTIPSEIDPVAARTLGAVGGGALGGALAHELVKDSKMSDGEKAFWTFGSAILFGFLGERVGNGVSKSTVFNKIKNEDVDIPPGKILSCATGY